MGSFTGLWGFGFCFACGDLNSFNRGWSR